MLTILAAALAFGCTSHKNSKLEGDKFQLLRSDPLLSVDVPGGQPQPPIGNAGSEGLTGSSAQVFRVWQMTDTSPATFASVITQARNLGVSFDNTFCSSAFGASGLKEIGIWTARVNFGLDPQRRRLDLMLAIGARPTPAPRPLPPRQVFIDPQCPPEIKAAVGGG